MELVSTTRVVRPHARARRQCRDSHARAAIGLEELWDRHGSSAYTLACVLLGDEATAAEAVRLAMADLAGDGVATAEAPTLARYVYRRTQTLAGESSSTVQLPPVMVRVSRLARRQRVCLGLCFFGGLTHREAAALLDIPPGAVADLLTAALRELGRLDGRRTPTSA